MNPDDELKQLVEKYHLPQAAGEDLAFRDIALHLWAEFQFKEDPVTSNGNWFRPLYFSQKELRWYKKHHAPAGLIVDERKGILDYDPKQIAQFIARTAKTRQFKRDCAEDTLRGLSKVIDWLITLQTELAEKLR